MKAWWPNLQICTRAWVIALIKSAALPIHMQMDLIGWFDQGKPSHRLVSDRSALYRSLLLGTWEGWGNLKLNTFPVATLLHTPKQERLMTYLVLFLRRNLSLACPLQDLPNSRATPFYHLLPPLCIPSSYQCSHVLHAGLTSMLLVVYLCTVDHTFFSLWLAHPNVLCLTTWLKNSICRYVIA